MESGDLKEVSINDVDAVVDAVKNFHGEEREILLSNNEKVIGAILTLEQYEWFLDQLDDAQDVSFIENRRDDLDGSVSLDDFKKELGE